MSSGNRMNVKVGGVVNGLSKRIANLATVTSILGLLVNGCAPMAASFKDDSGVGKTETTPTATPAPVAEDKTLQLQCLDNQPDYILNTDILYFQVTDQYGVNAGVNLPMGILSAIGLGVNYATGDLSTAMHLVQPLSPSVSIDHTGTAQADQVKFDANLGINIVDLGFNYYTTTSLADLSMAAMKDNLAQVVPLIKEEWTSHISNVYDDTSIEIPVGTMAGVQAGDTFSIYDVAWEFSGGSPCKGALKIARRLSPDPIATAYVSQAPSATTSVLTILSNKTGKKLSKYGLVTVSQLLTDKPTCTTSKKGKQTCTSVAARAPLKRSVRIGPVTGSPILFNTGSGNIKVDITPFAAKQLTTLINDVTSDQGLYLMQ